jgi:hypothetical protein
MIFPSSPNFLDKLEDMEDWVGFSFGFWLDVDVDVDGLEEDWDIDVFFLLGLDFKEEALDF